MLHANQVCIVAFTHAAVQRSGSKVYYQRYTYSHVDNKHAQHVTERRLRLVSYMLFTHNVDHKVRVH